jgi:glycosyltransferase involved in cell wall biosynthesis
MMTFSPGAPGATPLLHELSPLVSVVIPCYNSARYLSETIESVLAQTYPQVEIIVVDDGSVDATAEIAQSYPVQYVYQRNRGISAARNAGISRSRGKYVQFLDHDDRLLPKAFELGVKLLEENPECAMAVGEHRYIQSDGTEIGQSHKHPTRHAPYQELLEHNFVETPCSALHRRSALESTGFFAEKVDGAEDYELYLRTARQSPVITHGAAVADYRLHDANISRNAEKMFLVSLRVLEMELPYLEGDRKKLRMYRQGIRFAQRQFGRRLTRELIGNREQNEDNRRKLGVLRRNYRTGLLAVMVSRLLPASLVNKLIVARVHPNEYARSAQTCEGLSLG